MVVPVLMTSCQVSEKPKIGPVTTQARMTPAARMKLTGRPAQRAVACASRSNRSRMTAKRDSHPPGCAFWPPTPSATPAFLNHDRPPVPDLVVPRGVQPFHLHHRPVRGRLVRLGPLAEALLDPPRPGSTRPCWR
jgi:hypothetical protein